MISLRRGQLLAQTVAPPYCRCREGFSPLHAKQCCFASCTATVLRLGPAALLFATTVYCCTERGVSILCNVNLILSATLHSEPFDQKAQIPRAMWGNRFAPPLQLKKINLTILLYAKPLLGTTVDSSCRHLQFVLSSGSSTLRLWHPVKLPFRTLHVRYHARKRLIESIFMCCVFRMRSGPSTVQYSTGKCERNDHRYLILYIYPKLLENVH